jgi:Zn-dependent protease with chaperone function
MPKAADFPYPPTPDDVPDGYTDFPPEYRSKQTWLLVWVYVVFLVYLGMLFGSLTLAAVSAATAFHGAFCCLGIPLAVLSLGVFAYLVSGFFARSDTDKRDLLIEITEDEHPRLFGFVRRLCDEIGVSEPHKIHVLPEPNAMAFAPIGLVHLFTPPKRELCVGVGLINALNLSEFKAVLAHEFGHFAQLGAASVYATRAAVIVQNLANGQSAVDQVADRWRKNGSLFGKLLYGVGWLIRLPLWLTYRAFARLQQELAREAEFHADRVGASLAGSNASVHALYRSRFADETFGMALADLRKAADHKLYTADLYYHQHAAGDILRRKKKDPEYGRPPKLETPLHGKRVQVFDEDSAEDHPPADYHPSDHEREEHVKSPFVAADEDDRSAWILFDEPADLRERLTYKMYRVGLGIRKGTALDEPKVVQKFIDDEHHETTYDEKYAGAYDDRLLNPGDLDDLDDLIRKEPWEDGRLAAVYEKLYHDLKDKVEERRDLTEELDRLRKDSEGVVGKKLKRKIKGLEKELEDANDWFRTLDRRVYLVYVQMSYRVDADLYYDLINRYRFHMAVQGIYKVARDHYHEAEMYFLGVQHLETVNAPPEVQQAFIGETLSVFRDARKALKKLLREAREINMPAMKNFEEGERLADFLLDETLIREAGEHGVSGKWIDKLFSQLEQVERKANRLHFKSLGQLLALQENIAEGFLTAKGFQTPANGAT